MNKKQVNITGKKLAYGYGKLLLRAALLAFVCWVLLSLVYVVCQMHGMDMFPAIKDGDLLIAYRLERDWKKGDVVIYRAEGQRYVGRIIARETDEIEITENGALIVNGTEQNGEILYRTDLHRGSSHLRIPEGCVYILGDKRDSARDSRDFGAVPFRDLEGKLISLFRRRGL